MREDIENAVKKAGSLFGHKSELKKIESLITNNETVIALIGANLNIISSKESMPLSALNLTNKRAGLLVITSKRILHYSKILFQEKLEQIPFDKVVSTEYTSGLVFSALKVHTASNIMEFDLPKNLVNEYSNLINEQCEAVKNSGSQSQAPAQIDIPAQIKKLSELKDQGILTPEEFETKKKDLLAKM